MWISLTGFHMIFLIENRSICNNVGAIAMMIPIKIFGSIRTNRIRAKVIETLELMTSRQRTLIMTMPCNPAIFISPDVIMFVIFPISAFMNTMLFGVNVDRIDHSDSSMHWVCEV